LIAQGRSLGFAVFEVFDNRDGNNDEHNRCNCELGNREVTKHGVLLCGVLRAGKV
jgi:hypothetical protein